jgi:transposase
MKRRKFSREFKVEAVKLVRERGVSAAQSARDLDIHENVLRKWVKEFGSDPAQAFPVTGPFRIQAFGEMAQRGGSLSAVRSQALKTSLNARSPASFFGIVTIARLLLA